MHNLYDVESLNALAHARRDDFLVEARQRQAVKQIRLIDRRTPSRFRRAIGQGLINAGSRISGARVGDLRQVDPVA